MSNIRMTDLRLSGGATHAGPGDGGCDRSRTAKLLRRVLPVYYAKSASSPQGVGKVAGYGVSAGWCAGSGVVGGHDPALAIMTVPTPDRSPGAEPCPRGYLRRSLLSPPMPGPLVRTCRSSGKAICWSRWRGCLTRGKRGDAGIDW